jgi:hypothetical protein
MLYAGLEPGSPRSSTARHVGRVRQTVCLLSDQARWRGNTEGTPPREPAGTRGQSSSAVSFSLRGFRGRPVPRLPAFAATDFDGKEAVPGSSPGEGSKPPQSGCFCRVY